MPPVKATRTSPITAAIKNSVGKERAMKVEMRRCHATEKACSPLHLLMQELRVASVALAS